VKRQLPVDVLHHEHGSIYEDAEIDRPDREEVRRDVLDVEADESEQQ